VKHGPRSDAPAVLAQPAKSNNFFYEGTCLVRAVVRPRTAIGQAGDSQLPITPQQFGGCLGSDGELRGCQLHSHTIVDHHPCQSLSTDRHPWGILVMVHSVSLQSY
jgi:hypothetical protein